jgi:hypothetical protein
VFEKKHGSRVVVVSLPRRCCISHQHSQRSLLLVPSELSQLKLLGEAHRIAPAVARRVQLIEASQRHPDWSTKQLAQVLHRHESWVEPRGDGAGKRCIRSPTRPDQGHLVSLPPKCVGRLTALACSLPRSHGVPLARWSRAELARHVATVPTLPTISARTVGRWLTAERIHPWRYHSCQHIQEPETFLQRARPVLRLYEQAAPLLGTCGSGWSARMRKPRFRPVEPSRLLVQPDARIRCINRHGTNGKARCT